RTAFNLLLIGGEAEGGRLDRLSGVIPEARVQLARNLPLAELAARLAGCVGFIGHDSGITHLAAAVGVPTLALWPETDEAIWRPLGGLVVVLRDPKGLASLDCERVMEQVVSLEKGRRFESDPT